MGLELPFLPKAQPTDAQDYLRYLEGPEGARSESREDAKYKECHLHY